MEYAPAPTSTSESASAAMGITAINGSRSQTAIRATLAAEAGRVNEPAPIKHPRIAAETEIVVETASFDSERAANVVASDSLRTSEAASPAGSRFL